MGVARRAGWACMLVAGALAAGPAGGAAAAAALPDGRGYELVSPTDKGGSDVMVDSQRTRARGDGNAVGFVSLGGFGDVHGAGVAFDYMAKRTGAPGTSGWISYGINPRQDAAATQGSPNGLDSWFVNDFSPDFACGVYNAMRPLVGVGSPADQPSLYVRSDLLTPGLGTFELVSAATVPVPSGIQYGIANLSIVAGMSDDCRHVAFETRLNLLADASGSDPKLYEWADGVLRLAGVLPDGSPAPSSIAGTQATFHYTLGTVSPDGSRVFFASPSDGNVYMRVDGSSTVQMNVSEGPSDRAQPATLWMATADGSRALFSTSEQLVTADVDASDDVYMFDADAPVGERLTLISPRGPEVGSSVSVVGASAHGDYVYFISAGQLVQGEPALGTALGLYAWHGGEVRFIGQMDAGTDAVADSVGASPGFVPLGSRVSPDGRYLMFMSTSGERMRGRWGFPGYDQGSCAGSQGCQELYVFDADAGVLRCASCNPSGAPATAAVLLRGHVGTGAANSSRHVSHAFSDDGRRVFFQSSEPLVAGDSNGRNDVYEYDMPSGTLHLISSGKDPADSYFMDASASGDDVFFVTRERLVGWDTDANYDLYDARVGGGLPDPVKAPPPCAGGTCQGLPGAAPVFGAPGSALFHGAGDVAGRFKRAHRSRRARCRRVHGRRARARCRRGRGSKAAPAPSGRKGR